MTFSACHNAAPSDRGNAPADYSTSPFNAPRVVGRIGSKEITESSGLAASRCQPDVLWTHNDSGGGNFIYAINAKGEKLGTWRLSGASSSDLEDMALFKDEAGQCFLYIGDIGNNARKRGEHLIYRVLEPEVSKAASESSKKNPLETAPVETLKFSYADIRHDAETLLVHPQTGDIYVLTKSVSNASGVYKIKADFASAKTFEARKIVDLSVPAIPNGLLTGGDISSDGKRLIVCDYFAAYELTLPSDAKDFDTIWKQQPERVDLGVREQGEAVCYGADGDTVFATSEKKNAPVIEVTRRNRK